MNLIRNSEEENSEFGIRNSEEENSEEENSEFGIRSFEFRALGS